MARLVRGRPKRLWFAGAIVVRQLFVPVTWKAAQIDRHESIDKSFYRTFCVDQLPEIIRFKLRNHLQ